MNKKWKFTSFVLASALICGVAGTSLVGCKDYDDDIDHLQGQIDENKGAIDANADAIAANKAAIDNILAKIEAGQYIQKVEKTANGIRVTLGDGTTATIVNGTDGKDGADGADGKDGVNGKSAYELAVEKGYSGTLEEWLESLKGADGADGVDGINGTDGVNGKSAYELAVEKGYSGTLEEWLESLKGEQGEKGEAGKTALIEISEDGYWMIDGVKTDCKAVGTDGKDGNDGDDGKSAYELAVENGFTGTVEEWLKSLKGSDGDNGKSAYELYAEGVTEGEPLSPEDWLASLKGVKGDNGKSAYDIYCSTVTDGKPMSEQEWLQSLVGLSPKIDEETGNWLVYDVATQKWVDTEVNATGTSMYVTAATGGIEGWTLYVKELKEDGTFSEDYVEIFMPGVAAYVTSLVHLPNTISAKYGDIVFFPVIATDYIKIASEAGKVYAYDYIQKEQYATLFKGWAEIEYIVNPQTLSDYKLLGFVNNQAVVTRAGDKSINWEATQKIGKLAVSAQGFEFVKTGNSNYDDPAGDKAGDFEKADMIAFQVQNTKARQDVVTSDFAVAKRLVVGQRDVNIEFTEGVANVKEPVLHTVKLEQINDAYLSSLPANLEVPFKTTEENPLHLRPLLESCVERFFTNIDNEETKGHFTLAELGFKNLTMEFEAISYKNAEVDQTGDYLQLDDDAVSFNQKNTAAGYREPIVKVILLHEGNLVTEKYLKIKVVPTIQEDLVQNENVGSWMLACNMALAEKFALSAVNMDNYFNACGFNKEEFLATYSQPTVTFTKDGLPYTEGDITVDGEMQKDATSGINYLKFTFAPTVEAGNYVAKIVYTVAGGNSSAKYKTITINASFNVYYPENGPLVANTNMWNSANQMEIRPADYSTGKAEYMGIIENGFNEFAKVLSTCPKAEATLHFGLANPETQKVNGVLVKDVVTVEYTADKGHVIKLANTADGKKLVNQAVQLRAWVTFNNEDADHTQWANINVDLTNSHLFDVKFVKPIIAVNEDMSNKLWLVDLQDDWKIALGSFFDIYNFQGATNGMIWDNVEGWKAKDLKSYNDVKVTYELAPDQVNLNKSRVVLDQNTGIVSWKKDQENPGETIPEGKIQPVKFIANVAHYWGVEKVEITVNVKDSKESRPDVNDIKHIPSGTNY